MGLAFLRIKDWVQQSSIRGQKNPKARGLNIQAIQM